MHVVSVASLLLSLGSWSGWAGEDRAFGGDSGGGGLGNHKLSEELISDLESGLSSLGALGHAWIPIIAPCPVLCGCKKYWRF